MVSEPLHRPSLEPWRRIPGGQQLQQLLACRHQLEKVLPARRTALQVRQRCRALASRQGSKRQFRGHASESGASRIVHIVKYVPPRSMD
jgi:hypothetical protein